MGTQFETVGGRVVAKWTAQASGCELWIWVQPTKWQWLTAPLKGEDGTTFTLRHLIEKAQVCGRVVVFRPYNELSLDQRELNERRVSLLSPGYEGHRVFADRIAQRLATRNE